MLAHAVEKQPRLGEMVAERFAALTDLVGVDALRIALETAVLCGGRRFFRPAAINGIRFVGCSALIDGGAMQRIPLAVVKRCYRTVDRYFMKVRPAESADLRIGVGKKPTLQQGIVGKIDARHDMPRAESDLLGFGKEVVRVAVERHFAQRRNGHQFFRDQLGRVENVEIEGVFVFLLDHLYAKFPLRVVPHLDGFPEISTVVVSVFPGEFLRLVPYQRTSPGRGAPMEFDEARFPFGIDQAEGMHTEALHAAQAFRDGPVGHGPDHHVGRFRNQADKVPKRIVGRAAGGDFVVRFWFDRVDEVRKLDGVLNEKHRHVIAHQVEVAFIGEKLHGETSYIAHGIA
ncbi:hypothetical protein D3C84_638730 [compost metagenome]